MAKEKNPLSLFPFELKYHYNNLGYKKVAEIIYKFTKIKLLIFTFLINFN